MMQELPIDQKAIEAKDKDFIVVVEPIPRGIGCCRRFTKSFWRLMGFQAIAEDDNKILDIQRSFFRSVFSRTAEPIMPLMTGLCFVFHTGYMGTSLQTYAFSCFDTHESEAFKAQVALGPSCHVDWILYGPNQVSFAWFLFLLLALLNTVYYARTSQFEYVPFFITVQWVLRITVVVFTYMSHIILFAEWEGYREPAYIQRDQNFNLVMALLFTIVDFYEIRFQHVIWVSYVFFCHTMLILGVNASTGIFVDHPTTTLSVDVVSRGFWFFYAILLTVFTVLYGFHLMKKRCFAPGGTLMKTSIVSHELSSGEDEPDTEEQPLKKVEGEERK